MVPMYMTLSVVAKSEAEALEKADQTCEPDGNEYEEAKVEHALPDGTLMGQDADANLYKDDTRALEVLREYDNVQCVACGDEFDGEFCRDYIWCVDCCHDDANDEQRRRAGE